MRKYKKWNKRSLQKFQYLADQQKTPKEISIILKRSLTAIYNKMTEYGITSPHTWKISEVNQLKELISKNKTAKEIATILHRSPIAIYGKAFKLNLKISRGRKINHDELIGRNFGRLIVIGYSHKERDKSHPTSYVHFYKVRCICGKEKIVRRNNLLRGTTKSCGCLKQVDKGLAAFNRLYDSYKRGARIRHYEFKLTKDQFKELCQKDCFYCGSKPIKFKNKSCKNGSFFYNGIDRLNNKIGYIIDNCVPCCKQCNQMKGIISHDQYKEKINTIFNRINFPIIYIGRSLS